MTPMSRRPSALIVPLAAVRDADVTDPWVLRLEGRHAVRHAVHLGLRSGGLAEVIEAWPKATGSSRRLQRSRVLA